MKALYNSNYPILIQGETGTGKTVLAKKIHQGSIFRSESYVYCNLAGLSDNLFESELFGHSKGSFTGAIADKLGFCEKAGRGTLFFDEIGEISLSQQKKLLQLLDGGGYYSVGSVVAKKFLGRFIFATNKDLEAEVRKGNFRSDLFYRLGGVAIELIPFRGKNDEVRKKAIEEAIEGAKTKHHLEFKSFREDVIDVLLGYSWPGNYRELKTTIELMVLKSKSPEISMKEVPLRLLPKYQASGRFKTQIADLEKKIIHNEIVNKGVGINKASKSLGISKTTLIAKLRRYGMSYENLDKINMNAA